jgi:cytochrome c oxidase subunit 4
MSLPEPKHQPIPLALYVQVWLGLIALTAVTVTASMIELYHVGVITMILIATVKSTLVALYFMHLRFEKWIFTAMLVVVLLTYAVFIGLTFADYGYR